jgi:hypothetical protein
MGEKHHGELAAAGDSFGGMIASVAVNKEFESVPV